jgi:hypothetical protein
MLVQLHHQNKKTGESIFIAQNDIDITTGDNGKEQERLWMEETNQKHPIPDGHQWMWCTENSEHFVKTEVKGWGHSMEEKITCPDCGIKHKLKDFIW